MRSSSAFHHSDLETTLNVYTHAIPESLRRAINRVAGILFVRMGTSRYCKVAGNRATRLFSLASLEGKGRAGPSGNVLHELHDLSLGKQVLSGRGSSGNTVQAIVLSRG